MAYLEHIQYVCSDLDRTIEFYQFIFGWPQRGRGIEVTADRTYGWVHLGSDDNYVAFRTPYNDADFEPEMAMSQNHFGVVVDDLSELFERLEAGGFDYIEKGAHPFRRRVYFRDPDGYEIEVVRYLSSDPAERNDYSIDGVGSKPGSDG